MGIWDRVKSRLGVGGKYDGYRDGGDGTYDDGAYGEYDTEGSYGEGAAGHGGVEGQRPAPMRGYGVDRAEYYNDNHAPLVSHADVRSQPLLVPPPVGQPPDRIPAPRAYRRTSNDLARLAQTDDALAFKDGLARTPGSLAQLQSERLRMEDTGKTTSPDGSASRSVTIPATRNAPARPKAEGGIGTAGRFGQHQVHTRVHRRVEHIRPMTYGDAEQVAQELRKGSVVVLDLRTTRPELAKRILDFSFGVASALEGQVDRHIDRVYIFTCNGAPTDEEKAAIRV
ncbi:MAG: cell division protein SepF [Coriobacteriales bacterium]|jgi:cell division inhibitor SepF|nr:cell division protein SepF [Coriobacteriales bacterium]